ncbi:DUF2726 domain-containing protein [Pseudomonadota bacterium]
MNFHEGSTRAILQNAARTHGATVYTKPRIADVVNIARSGLDDDHFSYALQAHFDFVVADQNELALFAVEFDGPLHESNAQAVRNDEKKNHICDKLNFPLARVRDEHLFRKARGINYLTWLTELFFSSEALVQAQNEGSIPKDEPLDPMMFSTNPNIVGPFPLFLSSEARNDIRSFHSEGILGAPSPYHFYGYDKAGGGHALVAIRASDGTLVACSSSIYLDGFGITASEAAEEIATVNLARMVREFKDSGDCTAHPVYIREKLIALLESTGGHLSWGGSGNLGFPVRYDSSGGKAKWTLEAFDNTPKVEMDVLAK